MAKRINLILAVLILLQICNAGYSASEKLIARINDKTWTIDSFRISPDGNRTAYITTVNDKLALVFDGQKGNGYDDVSNPIFSPDSKHIAYIAKENYRFFVVFDGKANEKRYDEIAKSSLVYTNDSKHIAFSARNAGKWFVVFDGMELQKYDFIIEIKANPDKADEIRYLALKDNSVYLIEEKATAQIDEATRQKLQALESAHEAGILNDEEYNRKKAELIGQNIPSTPTATQRQGKTHTSPNGFSFWYPDDWKVTEEGESIQIFPPNPAMANGAVVELYYVVMETVEGTGIQRPDDPQIMEYLSGQLQPLSPELRYIGEAKSVKTDSGSGVMLDWEAPSNVVDPIIARAFVTISDKKALMLVCMGLKNAINARDSVLKQIFASLGTGNKTLPSMNNVQQNTQNQVSSQLGAGEVGDPNWGFKFVPPTGWKSQKTASEMVLGHDTIAGMIVIMPHLAKNIQDLQTQMQEGLQEEDIQLLPAGTLQPTGNNMVIGNYSGIIQGQQVKALGIGTLSHYGGGAFIIAVATPEKYGNELASSAEAIAKSMQYFKVEVSDLMQHFVGTWTNYTTNTETQITLAPDGSYYENYEASYSGNFNNQYGDTTGNWGAYNKDNSQGRWTV